MQFITSKNAKEFAEAHPDAEQPVLALIRIIEASDWRTSADIKATLGNASIINNSRVVFNVAGNKFRMIVEINYQTGWVFMRFLGTHQDYDKVDAATVKLW